MGAELQTWAGLPVTVHAPLAARDRHVAVLYLHGGGLVYGERDDLPTAYVRLFTGAGYTLVCMDYPLAPETPLVEILDAAWTGLCEHVLAPVAAGTYAGYFLFGRSSGAYLALQLAARARRERASGALAGAGLPQPFGVLDFYGYPGMREKAFMEPAKAYTALPAVDAAQVERIVGTAPVTSGPKALRYAIYVHGRQSRGAWLGLLGLLREDGTVDERLMDACSLSADDVAALPPLFITASSTDEDVPFRASKTLSRQAPQAVMKPVYYLPHDFDRDVGDPTGRRIYQDALAWMDGLVL